MIFNNDKNHFESEKERNFYYKIFAGYIFNELIEGYEERVNIFIDILNKPIYPEINPTQIPHLSISSVSVSFDNHTYLINGYVGDAGEFADILIQDIQNKIIIPIEVKLFSDWSYDKDIQENTNRQRFIRNQGITTYPVLLIKKDKWDNVKNLHKHSGSNYSRVINSKEINYRVIIWEDLLGILKNPKVLHYAKTILIAKDTESMKVVINDGWFKGI